MIFNRGYRLALFTVLIAVFAFGTAFSTAEFAAAASSGGVNVDLSWDTSDPAKKTDWVEVTTAGTDIKLAYKLSIEALADYDEGKLEVRIPYALLEYRNGAECIPDMIGVPKAPATNPNYAFNYKIDDNGTKGDFSDDTLIFTNCRKLDQGTKDTIQVTYTVRPGLTIDCSVGELKALAAGTDTGGNTVNKDSQTISFKLDTGMNSGSIRRTSATPIYNVSSTTSYEYIPGHTFDASRYHYVAYEIVTINYESNQPYTLDISGKISDGGFVAAYWSSTNNIGKAGYDSSTGNVTVTYGSGKGAASENKHYLLVAYPIGTGTQTYPIDYSFDATLDFKASDNPRTPAQGDYNDLQSASTSISAKWNPFAPAEGYTCSKKMDAFPNGSLETALRAGKIASAEFDLSVTKDTYEGQPYADGLTFTMTDDNLRAIESGTVWTQLNKDDYELRIGTNTAMEVSLYDYDRNTADKIYPDSLWKNLTINIEGQTADGNWTTVYTYNATGVSDTVSDIYTKAGSAALTAYTAFRISSTDDNRLKGHFELKISDLVLNIKPTSPTLKKWIDDEGIEAIRISNAGTVDFFDKSGKSVLKNPAAIGDSKPLSAIKYSSGLSKSWYPVVNDTANSKADVTFTMMATEQVDSPNYPKEIDDAIELKDGIFYDLLPRGYYLNESKPILACVRYLAKNEAAVYDVKTIDNYKGSGRQLVIFKVKPEVGVSTVFKDNNYTYTRFTVQYTASISWEDYELFNGGYNDVIFERNDGKTVKKGFPDVGYGDTKTIPTATVWPTDKSGNYILADIDGDNDTTTKDKLFAYCLVDINLATTVENGIKKYVLGSSGKYAKEDTTAVGSDYRYRIDVTTTAGGTTEDVIVYDILENAAKASENSWKGTFDYVDTSIAESQGIDVRVYYCTQDISYSDKTALALNSGYWTTVCPQDTSTVKALAFDLSSKKDGSKMTFKENSTVCVEVFMKAPATLPANAKYAYNQAAYDSTYTAAGSKIPQNSFMESSRTRLSFATEVSGKKTWDGAGDTTGNRPDFIEIQLYQTVDGKTTPVQGKTAKIAGTATGDDLEYSWKDLPMHDDNDKPITYSVKEEGVVNGMIDGKNGAKYIVTYSGYDVKNTYTGPVSIMKTDMSGNALTGAQLQLFEADGTTPAQMWDETQNSYVNAEWISGSQPQVIVGLSSGSTYILKESSPPMGYVSIKGDISFDIDDSFNIVNVTGNTGDYGMADGTLLVQNDVAPTPMSTGTLVITKRILGDITEAEAEGVLEFKVTAPDGKTGLFTLKDFKHTAGTDLYTLELPQVVTGQYTVEETAYNITGKQVKASYEINKTGVWPGTTAQPILVKDDTVVVAFEDDYKLQPDNPGGDSDGNDPNSTDPDGDNPDSTAPAGGDDKDKGSGSDSAKDSAADTGDDTNLMGLMLLGLLSLAVLAAIPADRIRRRINRKEV